ncbi:PHO85 cyclin-1 [Choanephora cucurbitarum]|uniref:PHO85 cyclin-1 n=1 Tax=Choanephora cucurbitarum TaxID=101091 RepID=A0A1C7NRF1_9FUNG|nr:PHO85 cyclin-1 [Choanephora cucurbitarum]
MLALPATITRKSIPPGFIDFASSSFDAILFPNAFPNTHTESDNKEEVRKRTTHLPDLIPFIQLITDKCDVQPVHLVMALMYAERFRKSLPAGFKPEAEAAHRIFVASILIASKYSEDRCLSTKHVVRATGDVWSIKEITRMEIAFLTFLHWDLYISQDEMTKFLLNLGFDINQIMPNNRTTMLEDTSPSAT